MNSESPPSRSDFKDLLNILADEGVRYLVVGAFAVMKYTEPRFTKDLDIWIAIDPVNASAVYRALAKFGAPLAGVAPDYFTERGRFYQLGISPVRVDVLTSLAGASISKLHGTNGLRQHCSGQNRMFLLKSIY